MSFGGPNCLCSYQGLDERNKKEIWIVNPQCPEHGNPTQE